MADDSLIGAPVRARTALGDRVYSRGAPAASDALAFTGGLGLAVAVLLFSVHFSVRGHGRPPGVALFALLLVLGYLALWVLPREIHAAAVTAIVASVPGVLGWWILPHAHRFADIRPFLVLVIVAYAGLFVAPRTRGRTIFLAVAMIVLWLWILGEVAGTGAYSVAPIPSPPAHTMFSLSAIEHHAPVRTTRAAVDLGSLDPSSPYYPIAQACAAGIAASCDSLYFSAPLGSDFRAFADSCGGAQAAGSGGRCVELEGGGFNNGTTPFTSPTFTNPPFNNQSPFPRLTPGAGAFGAGTNDKSTEIGFVSLLFGLAYIGALALFDRRRWRGLGTACIVPGVLALFTGTEVLGQAVHHAWAGGLFTFVAGIGVALVGDVGGRRFTTWAGGVLAALGAYAFAGDVANLKDTFSSTDEALLRPAFITLGFGAVMIGVALAVALLRTRLTGPAPTRPPGGAPGPLPAFPSGPPASGPPASGSPPFPLPTPPAPTEGWRPPPADPAG